MALSDRAFSVVADIIGISAAELLFGRTRAQSGGQQTASPPPPPNIPQALARIPEPQRTEVAQWLGRASAAKRQYMDRIPVDGLVAIFTLPTDERDKVLAGAPGSWVELARQAKAFLETRAPDFDKTRKRWEGYSERHGHKDRQARDAAAREDGPVGIPQMFKGLGPRLKRGMTFEGPNLWERFLRGFLGRR